MSSLMRRVFINPDNSSELLAAGVSGIYKSTDTGDNWSQIDSRFIWDIEQQPDNPDVLYATTHDFFGGICSIIKSTDFGDNWQLLNTGIPANDTVLRIEVAIAPSDSNYVYAACGGWDDAFYAFYQSADCGETWTKKADSSQVNIFGQLNGDPDNKLAQSSYDLWAMVDPNDPERVFTGAMNIWGSEDGGENWSITSLGIYWFGESIHFDHHFVKQSPLDGKFYFCSDGGLYRTDSLIMADMLTFDSCFDNNHLTPDCFQFETEWEDLSGGIVITEFYRLGLSKNNPGWVIAGSQDNCTFYKNDMEEWINVTNGDGMECMIEPDNTNVIYAANQFGVLYKSINGGQTMSNMLTGTILNQEGLGVWLTPFVMDQQSPYIIYAGFRNLWKSEAGGTGWSKISDFPDMPGYNSPKPIWDVALSPTNPDVIFLSKQPYPIAGIQYYGELWKTINGGLSWENITNGLPGYHSYINDIAITENPDVVYVACLGFEDGKKVYKTVDGGLSWENISGNLPNLPVTSVVCQLWSSKNDVYIGSDLGVYHINDDYTDWQLYSDNLPNVVVNELEINYSESMLYAATYGRGIWITELLNPVTGLEKDLQEFESSEISLYPNPSNGIFNIKIETRFRGNLEIQIIDIKGNIVTEEPLQISSQILDMKINVSDLPSGVYFVKVGTGERSKVCKVLLD